MNILFNVINITGVILEILIALSFFKTISNRKQIPICYEIIISVLCMGIQSFVILIVNKQVIVTISLFLLIIAISLQYKLTVFKRFIFCVVLMILFVLSELVIGLVLTTILGISVERLSIDVLCYMQGVLISKLIMFVMIKIVGLFSIKSEVRISRAIYITFVTLPITTFLVVYILSEYTFKSQDGKLLNISILASIFLIISNILVFYIFEYQIKIAENQREEQLLKQQLEYKAEYYKELSGRQRITNKTMHDLKNQLFALREIYKKNPIEGMEKIDSICEEVLSEYTLRFTGIEAVDALITSKILVMKENNIRFSNSIYLSKENKMDIVDMCVLLGNLLDNAIEANTDVEKAERFINLNIAQQMDYLSINISNSISKEIRIVDTEIKSTKKHKELHGFGLKSVKEIVKKYDGNVVFKQIENKFEVFILLKNK